MSYTKELSFKFSFKVDGVANIIRSRVPQGQSSTGERTGNVGCVKAFRILLDAVIYGIEFHRDGVVLEKKRATLVYIWSIVPQGRSNTGERTGNIGL